MRKIPLLPVVLAVAACCLAAAGGAPSRPIPPMPDGAVFDDAKLLDPEHIRSLQAALADFKKHQSVPAAFAAFTLPPGEDSRAAADAVRAAWFPDKPSLVLVYSRRDMSLGLSHSGFLEEKLTPPQILATVKQTGALLDPTGKAENSITGMEVVLASLHMLRSFDVALGAIEEGRKPTTPDRVALYLGYVALVFVALALPIWLVFRQRKSDRRRSEEIWLFPEVNQPQRLGGPCHGGGGVTLDHTTGKTE